MNLRIFVQRKNNELQVYIIILLFTNVLVFISRFDARDKIYFIKILQYGVLILLNHSDKLFDTSLKFAPMAQTPLPPQSRAHISKF